MARRRVAGAGPDVGEPPDRRAGGVAAPDAEPAAASGGVALELARPELDDSAVLVAGLGPGSDPGWRQRLAPRGLGRSPGPADDVGRGGSRRPRRGPVRGA